MVGARGARTTAPGKPAELNIVSGYRDTSFALESRHPGGAACDFSIVGVPNLALFAYLSSLPHVGVGYYPNSTFVHLDVRPKKSVWVDLAGPGEPPRYVDFFSHTCPRDWQILDFVRVRIPQKLPSVLSREETLRLLGAVREPTRRTALQTIYALGLRLND